MTYVGNDKTAYHDGWGTGSNAGQSMEYFSMVCVLSGWLKIVNLTETFGLKHWGVFVNKKCKTQMAK